VTRDAQPGAFAPKCVSIDLEIGRKDGRIHRFAAIRGDTGETVIYARGDLAAALRRLDTLAHGTAFLLGHNLVTFDRRHLAAALPSLELLNLPDVDTPRLSPLAFPRNLTATWSSTTRTRR
jgi:ATP-dependent DNA helicase RecQ